MLYNQLGMGAETYTRRKQKTVSGFLVSSGTIVIIKYILLGRSNIFSFVRRSPAHLTPIS